MKQAHILVVEDEAIVGMDIRESLESFGYTVTGPITSGEEALKMASSEKPNLVLMDIMLQGQTDGVTTAEQIRSKLGIPVVYLTALADATTFSRAKVTEPYGYVLKPFKKIELRTVIELALYRHSMDQQRVSTPTTSPNGTSLLASLIADAEKYPMTLAEKQSATEFLRTVEPFNCIDNDSIQSIAPVCHFQAFKAGDFLVLEGDEKCSPFLIVTGRVVLVKSSPSGKDLIVEFVSPGDSFGLLAALERGNAPFSAKAQIDSLILWVPANIVAHIVDRNPEISRRLMAKVLERLRKSHDLSRALAHDRVEVRVASALLAMLPQEAEGQGKVMSKDGEIKLSRQELADMTGTAPETASRVANALEREGLLDLSQIGQVRVLDRQKLSELIDL